MLAFPGFGAKGECQENRPDPHHVQNLVEKVTAKKIQNTLLPLHGTKLGTTPNLLGSLEESGTSMVFTKEPLFVLTAYMRIGHVIIGRIILS